MKKGSLIIVGSGIKGVGQITLETQGWIQQADIVLYCVSDPATAFWIENNSQQCFDLYTLYANGKRRIETYNQMVDALLTPMRQKKSVCGVFYGHPGVFVYPSHRAIAIARSEGYKAAMLPGISALDCLFADLGIDPSRFGCQTFEATDLLLRNRQINADGHVIIWQIGCVGDLGFNFAGYDARNLGILTDYLLQVYPSDHPMTIYEAAQYPVCQPRIVQLPLQQLTDTKVTGISTLYIPPSATSNTNQSMAEKLGLMGGYSPTIEDISPRKSPFAEYVPPPSESGLAEFMIDLSTNPRLLAHFRQNPQQAIAKHAHLTPEETKALLSFHSGIIRLGIQKPEKVKTLLKV